ncbi:MAG: hypothetical protein HOQ21_06000 [Dermatophilaceae bacterium]|nr:hypothetical protein [Dermatophilaceae bacterium]
MPWQPAAVRYPDAELVVAGLIRSLLASHGEPGMWVGRRLPSGRPGRAVQVVRDGGSADGLRDRARLRVLTWDATDQKVTDLARLVVAVAPLMAGQQGVVRVQHLSGPYEIPDAAPCRYLLFQVDLRGVPLP